MMTEKAINIDRLDRLAQKMDSLIRIPGTQITLGLDSILGLVPVVGDALALAPSVYIFREGHRAGISPHDKGRMLANIGIDWVIGSIPLVGDLFDIGFKSKVRNVAIIREHLEREGTAVPRPSALPPLPDRA